MKHKSISLSLATLGPIGYLPAPGTMATLCTLPFIYLFSFFAIPTSVYIVGICIAAIIAFKIIEKALEGFRQRDPSEIVLDEVVGCLIVFLAVPVTVPTLLAGFFLFRFFDIAKPFGIKKTELLYGSLGVMMDDILCGILVNIILTKALVYFG